MCEGAGGDEVGAGIGQLGNALQRHTPGNLDFRAAARAADHLPDIVGPEVVDENHVHAGIERLVDFVQRLRLDLDGQIGTISSRPP